MTVNRQLETSIETLIVAMQLKFPDLTLAEVEEGIAASLQKLAQRITAKHEPQAMHHHWVA